MREEVAAHDGEVWSIAPTADRYQCPGFLFVQYVLFLKEIIVFCMEICSGSGSFWYGTGY
jgi:hypothetical protein